MNNSVNSQIKRPTLLRIQLSVFITSFRKLLREDRGAVAKMGTTYGPTHRNEIKLLRCNASIRQVKSWIQVESPVRPVLIFDFCSMKTIGVFILPLDGMPVHRRLTPSIEFPGTDLNAYVERATVRVKCAG